MSRSVHGIELTAAGPHFSTMRGWRSPRQRRPRKQRGGGSSRQADLRSRVLTGKEIDWLPEAMRILHDELPNIDVTVSARIPRTSLTP